MKLRPTLMDCDLSRGGRIRIGSHFVVVGIYISSESGPVQVMPTCIRRRKCDGKLPFYTAEFALIQKGRWYRAPDACCDVRNSVCVFIRGGRCGWEHLQRLCQDARLLVQILQNIEMEVASVLQGNIIHFFKDLLLQKLQSFKIAGNNFILFALKTVAMKVYLGCSIFFAVVRDLK